METAGALLVLAIVSAAPGDTQPLAQTPPSTDGEAGVTQLPIAPKSHPDPNVLERSYLLPFFEGLAFEAQIAPHIFIWDNFQKLYQPVDPGRSGHFAAAVSFTPMVRLRMQDAESSPIKTLSWMPKVDVQLVWMRRRAALAENDERASAWTLQATVGHHSNGQDECSYVPGVLSRPDLCPDPTRLEDVRINYPNGDFSTNYVRLGVTRKWLTLRTLGSGRVPVRTFLLGGAFEANPAGLRIGGTLPPVLRTLYGCNRLLGRLEWETRLGDFPSSTRSGLLRGSLRISGAIEYLDKAAPTADATFTSQPDAPLNALYTPATGSSRWRFSSEVAWNPDALRGWGLVARYLRGQDHYNLLFIRNIDFFQAGVVFDAGELQLFGR